MSTRPLSDHIKRFRKAERHSLASLAELIGITKGHLWEIEDGQQPNPRLSTLIGIARATRTTLARIATLAAQQRQGGAP